MGPDSIPLELPGLSVGGWKGWPVIHLGLEKAENTECPGFTLTQVHVGIPSHLPWRGKFFTG